MTPAGPAGAVLTLALAAPLVLGGCGEEGAGTRVASEDSTSDSAAPAPSDPTPVTAAIDPCPRSGPAATGEDALPDVELACLGPGAPVTMSGLSGAPMVVNVWASWCAPCRDEMPWLQRLDDTGTVEVLGIDAEDQTAAAAALLAELEVTYPSVFDPSNSFARDIGVVSKPMSVLVSERGDVVKVVPGAFESYQQLVDVVEAELDVEVG